MTSKTEERLRKAEEEKRIENCALIITALFSHQHLFRNRFFARRPIAAAVTAIGGDQYAADIDSALRRLVKRDQLSSRVIQGVRYWEFVE